MNSNENVHLGVGNVLRIVRFDGVLEDVTIRSEAFAAGGTCWVVRATTSQNEEPALKVFAVLEVDDAFEVCLLLKYRSQDPIKF